MSLQSIFLGFGLVAIFYQWIHPLNHLYIGGVISKAKYKTYRWIGRGLVALLLSSLITASVRNLTSTNINIILGGVFLLIVLFNNKLHSDALKQSKGDKQKRILLWITSSGMLIGLVSIIIQLLIDLTGIQTTFNTMTIMSFGEDRDIWFVMFLRIVGFSYVGLLIYVLMVYAAAIDFKIEDKIEQRMYANQILSKNLGWTRLSFVLVASVMLSFLHFAEINLRSISDDYHEFFVATRDVYHLIATALFIPLLFEQLHSIRNERQMKFNNLKKRKGSRYRGR